MPDLLKKLENKLMEVLKNEAQPYIENSIEWTITEDINYEGIVERWVETLDENIQQTVNNTVPEKYRNEH